MIQRDPKVGDERLNRGLALLKQAFERLIAVAPIEELSSAIHSDANRRATVEELLSEVQIVGEAVHSRLEHYIGSDREFLVQAPPGLARFYERTYLPARDTIRSLYWQTLWGNLFGDVQGEADGSSPTLVEPQETPVLETIRCALESQEWRAEDNPDWPYEITCFKEARKVVSMGYFKPDLWLENMQQLRPVVSDRASRDYRGSIRLRVRELYRSFIFGNYLGVCALARSLVEYALVDRARFFGIDPYEPGTREPRSLSYLIGSYREPAPELFESLDQIRKLGNQVLHLSAEDMSNFPPGLKQNAIASIGHTRAVIFHLYAKQDSLRA